MAALAGVWRLQQLQLRVVPLVTRALLSAAPQWRTRPPILQPFSTAADQATFDTISRFKERPWEYLESEEYIERYGSQPVWADYRRNHKGAIPPQKTRKTCIRGDKISGNPCPICRDPKIQVDHRNVKLLEQFICSHTGIPYHPTRTGVCMKQFKKLTTAIQNAKDNGLLRFAVPHVEVRLEDYCGSHAAVGKTPPLAREGDEPWYSWYQWQQPPEKEIARIRQMYKPFLKETATAEAPSETPGLPK
ncbi:28S ribosomal protein S18b, mitochondrial [Amblyraja radiata]|uniref:28S ribosomal protein S18b, mitochondrial n=1 Tax=Amblyraja radiata TaxID=386614 RepID=UPI001401D5CF|nr:28S ribosomal protein S18b, mitochondrial [Amblyraja radiata]